MAYNKLSILICGECRFVATLRESYRTNVAHNVSLVSLFEFPQMCMSIYKYVVFKGRAVLLVVYVSVCEEEALCAVYDEGVVCHYRELEQHLVYLCVAIAAHGYDVVFASVKQFDDAFRVDAFGYAVARSVVKYVAQNAEHVIVFAVVEAEHLLQRWQTTVNIRNE